MALPSGMDRDARVPLVDNDSDNGSSNSGYRANSMGSGRRNQLPSKQFKEAE